MSQARHHIDRRAARLLSEAIGDDDALIDTSEVANWLGLSPQWLEIGRHRGYGPPFVKLAPRIVRYRIADVRRWLRERTAAHSKRADAAQKPAQCS